MSNKLTLGIGFLGCNGDLAAGGGGLDGGAGRGGGCPNLVTTSEPSDIPAGSPSISSSGLLTSNSTTNNWILTSDSNTTAASNNSLFFISQKFLFTENFCIFPDGS
jgi:hypothetical protein